MKVKNKKTKILIIVLTIVGVLGLAVGAHFVFSGLNKEDPTDPSGGNKLELSSYSKSIDFMSTFSITADYTEISGEKLSFETENAAVCKVSKDGDVTGVGLGETNIVVKYASLEKKCSVSVVQTEKKPILAFKHLANDENIVIKENELLDLNCVIKYDKIDYEDCTPEYTLSKPQLGVIDNGVLKINTLSQDEEFSIQVKAKWRGFELPSLTKTLNVKVIKTSAIESDHIEINGSLAYPTNIVLHLSPENGETSKNFEYKRFINGVESNVINFTQEGYSIKIQDGQIKAVREGVTNLYISVPNPIDAPVYEVAYVNITITVLP